MRSELAEKIFLRLCEQRGVGQPTPEYRFHAERRWRFDYAWPKVKVALEVEGGVFGFADPKTGQRRSGGAHSSITGIKRDMEKYSIAAVMGWCVIRILPTDLTSWKTLAMVEEAITRRARVPDVGV